MMRANGNDGADGGMHADEVIAVIDWLEQHGAVHVITGGWAVDALVGRATRRHRDLDVIVEAGADITEEVLQKAKLGNKFIELSMSAQ